MGIAALPDRLARWAARGEIPTGTVTTVAAIVVTYRRMDVLRSTIRSLTEQQRRPDAIVVVANDGQEHASLASVTGANRVAVLRKENLGFSGGLAAGITFARERVDPDWYWLMDDDSPVTPDSLSSALAIIDGNAELAVLGNRGGRLSAVGRLGRKYKVSGSVPQKVDYSLLDGALVSRLAIETIGLPRSDFFMGFEDIEYTLRATSAGLTVALAGAVTSSPLHLGSSGTNRSAWRAYYQTRNHWRTAIDHRSVKLGLGAALRLVAQLVAALLGSGGSDMAVARLRVKGFWDALGGRMGRTIDPATWTAKGSGEAVRD